MGEGETRSQSIHRFESRGDTGGYVENAVKGLRA